MKLRYAGPYVIHEIRSPHMFILKDLSSHKCLPRAIHINRLKPAYVRKPNPTNYFMDSVETKILTDTDQKFSSSTESNMDNSRVENENNTSSNETDSNQTQTQDTDKTTNETELDSLTHKKGALPLRRSSRVRKKPSRFDDDNFTDLGDNTTSDRNFYYKVKRILAQRMVNGTKLYLAHFAGEPSQNSSWVKESQ